MAGSYSGLDRLGREVSGADSMAFVGVECKAIIRARGIRQSGLKRAAGPAQIERGKYATGPDNFVPGTQRDAIVKFSMLAWAFTQQVGSISKEFSIKAITTRANDRRARSKISETPSGLT